jgi:alpha-beta hydrolase superfamily lysophospholipase
MMKKRWLVITAAVLVGLFLCALYLWSDNIDSEFKRAPEMGLARERNSLRWYYKSPFKRRRGVALVVHGLNLKPEKMEPIIRQLNRAGIDALNVSLHGHGENYLHQEGRNAKEARLDAFRRVTYPLWSSEVHQAYLQVRERGRGKKARVFLVGYSLGGLLGCDLLVSKPGVRFDRMALLAPALNVAIESYLLRALMPFPNLVIDSVSPARYRSNDGTPVAGYNALFEALDHFQRSANPALDVPTLVLMDREDEFISYEAMRQMIIAQRLGRWEMMTVRKAPDAADLYAHHLLIDEAATGKEAWAQITGSLVAHLLLEDQGQGTAHDQEKASGAALLP